MQLYCIRKCIFHPHFSHTSAQYKLFLSHISTSTILGQEVAERALEDVHVRAGYILGILFVLLIQKYFILFYFIIFYFILSYFILIYHFILFYFFLFHVNLFFHFIAKLSSSSLVPVKSILN